MKRRSRTALLGVVVPTLVAASAAAQTAPGGAPTTGGAATPAGNGGTSTPASDPGPAAAVPAAPPGGAVYAPYGLPSGSAASLNSHLPSSSQPSLDTSRAADGFDLEPNAGGNMVVRGSPGGSFSTGHVESAEMVPSTHVVQRGDTLWDICDRYFHNPWDWPRVWSYNPELQNPHWIYPGGLIRMQAPGVPGQAAPVAARGPSGFVGRAPGQPGTIYLREQGYIDDPVKGVWGDIGGSPDDQLLLSEGDSAYLDILPERDVTVGQDLTIFRPLRSKLKGDAKGTLVEIIGTARVEKWDPETRVARARLTESFDVIERGAKVGPVGRRFEVVAPVRNASELWVHIAASIYPHELYGQNQVVFIDKGQKDGLVPGNRLFVVTRGDEYRKTLGGASQDAAAAVHYETAEPAVIEPAGALGHGDDAKYPEEVTGELRVLTVRDHSAACLVISSIREIEAGQRAVARRGY